MTGLRTVGDYVVPTITRAAAESGRPAPRVAVSLPVSVGNDPDGARGRIDEAFAIYPTLPSYRAMLEREGASKPSDIALVGDEEEVHRSLGRLAEAGATDFVAAVVGDAGERRRTLALLSAVAGQV